MEVPERWSKTSKKKLLSKDAFPSMRGLPYSTPKACQCFNIVIVSHHEHPPLRLYSDFHGDDR